MGPLDKLPLVHLEKRVHDPPLHGLESALQIRNGPILDHIRGVFEKVFVKKVFDGGHV
jgi:hypothetical protein